MTGCLCSGTPYDLSLGTGGLKFRAENSVSGVQTICGCSALFRVGISLHSQLYNFKHNLPRTYVPVPLLAASVHESESMDEEDKVRRV